MMARYHALVSVASVCLLLAGCNAGVIAAATTGVLQGAAQGWRTAENERRTFPKDVFYKDYPEFVRVRMPNFPKNASCSSTSEAYDQPKKTTGNFFVVLSKSMITNTSCHADGYRAFMITTLNTPIWLSETVEEADFYKYDGSVVLKAKMAPESFATIGAWQRYFQIREEDWSLQISSWRFAHHKEYRCNAQPEEQVCKTLSAAILKIDKEQRTALIEEKRISKPATGA